MLLARFGVVISAKILSVNELILLGAVIATGLLASLVPGWRAHRLSLADGLSPRT